MKRFSSLTISFAVSASLLGAPAFAGVFTVEQYDDFWSTDLSALQSFADNNVADSTAEWTYIDFTDDPAGFAGFIPGSNLWPSAAAAGVSGTGNPLNDTFFARITATVSVATAGDYFFQTYSDDGVFLLVDDNLVINDPSLHPEAVNKGSTFLGTGYHGIELFFFENGGEASLEFTVADASENFKHFNDNSAPVTVVNSPIAAVSEPGTFGLLAAGVLGVWGRRKYMPES